ncbi:MAG: hypothetical protein R3B82_05540 [Sandaracinaceae bacterium]
MDLTTRIVVGVVSVAFLLVYFGWRWKRAGDYVKGMDAAKQAAGAYYEAMRRDPRWLALEAKVRERYPISYDFSAADPSVFLVHKIGLVDDQGFMYRLDNPAGPVRVTALIVRQQPSASLYVSMHLHTGELREDPAPHGWTYVGPPR